MKRSDWFPTKRETQLAMAESWGEAIAEKRTEWNIPQTILIKFTAAITNASNEHRLPQSGRNAVTNARLRMAFNELTALMRDIKKRYFFIPPLDEVDFAALGIKPKDTTLTTVPQPIISVDGKLLFPAVGMVEMREIKPAGEKSDARSTHGVRIYYGITGEPTETNRFRISNRPATGNDLPHSVFTRRNRHRFDFTGESGKEVFFCMRYENSKGEAGPWGKIISAFIP